MTELEIRNTFSGNVILEIFNWAHYYDRSVAGWGQCYEHFVDSGDVWIGVTIRGRAVESLKKFDPDRYAPLTLNNPLPEDQWEPQANAFDKTEPYTENGLIWDMISQIAALIKSEDNRNPLRGYNVKSLIGTGATGGDLSAYVAAVHPLAADASGMSLFDGFLIYMTGAPGGLNQAEDKLHHLDPRCKIYSEVPLVRVYTMGDMFGTGYHPDWACMQRREDSDDPSMPYRGYEVAGAGVVGMFYRASAPCQEDVERAGGKWTSTSTAVEWQTVQLEKYEFPTRYILAGAFQNLKRWINDGIEPPRAAWLESIEDYPNTTFKLDAYGNVMGGVRTPYVDCPLYKFSAEGDAISLEKEVLQGLYQNKEAYVIKVIDNTIKLFKEGWIVEKDARKIIMEAIEKSAIL